MKFPRPIRISTLLCLIVCLGGLLVVWHSMQASHYHHTKVLSGRQKASSTRQRAPLTLQKPSFNYEGKPVVQRNMTRFLDTDVIYTYLDWRRQQGSDIHIDHELINYHLKEMRVLMNNTQQKYPGEGMPAGCATKDYGDLADLPKASIYMTFHNSEHMMNILHTLHSIFENSPHELIHEIILIDDNSVKEELKDILQNYVDSIFGRHVTNIRIIRSQTQLGLIRGRLLGARLAEGDVIVSMDSHMELRPGWLESMLYEIKINRRTLASSCLDWMKPQDDGSWVYEHGGSVFRGVFDWDLAFGYYNRYISPDMDPTEPLLTPMIVGTIFAMERKFFFEVGGFDEGMEAWGGENIDLSLRAFMCGGRVINVPCSHAAHLEAHGQRDYRAGWDKLIQRNYNRVVMTLFGPYKKYFEIFKPSAKEIEVGDISERIASIQKCSGNMSTYLDNFYPEMGNPENDALAYGRLKNMKTGKCIDRNILGDGKLYSCHEYGTPQTLIYTSQGYLRTGLAMLHVDGEHSRRVSQPAAVSMLDPEFRPTRWIHWKDGLVIVEKTQKCLEASRDSKVSFNTCDIDSDAQHWSFDMYTENYDVFLRGGDLKDSNILSSASANELFRKKYTATLQKYNKHP